MVAFLGIILGIKYQNVLDSFSLTFSFTFFLYYLIFFIINIVFPLGPLYILISSFLLFYLGTINFINNGFYGGLFFLLNFAIFKSIPIFLAVLSSYYFFRLYKNLYKLIRKKGSIRNVKLYFNKNIIISFFLSMSLSLSSVLLPFSGKIYEIFTFLEQ